jgi:hypothetical protein
MTSHSRTAKAVRLPSMPDGPDIAVFVLLALPGFIAVGLYESLTPTIKSRALTHTASIVVVSILSYLVIYLLNRCWSKLPDPHVLLAAAGLELTDVFSSAALTVVSSAAGVGVLLGMVAAVLRNHGLLHRLMRTIGVTRRTGHSSHWDHVVLYRARRCWVNVKFKDGSEYVGAIDSHSDSSEERSLLLMSIRKCQEDGSSIVWDERDRLFIPDLGTVRSIRLINPDKESNDVQEGQKSPRTEGAEAEPKGK